MTLNIWIICQCENRCQQVTSKISSKLSTQTKLSTSWEVIPFSKWGPMYAASEFVLILSHIYQNHGNRFYLLDMYSQ
jgi:hypothetical protein